MNANHAFSILVRYADAAVPDAERVHLYEAIVAVAKKAHLKEQAEAARTVCLQLRAADRAQMKFRSLLRVASEASHEGSH